MKPFEESPDITSRICHCAWPISLNKSASNRVNEGSIVGNQSVALRYCQGWSHCAVGNQILIVFPLSSSESFTSVSNCCTSYSIYFFSLSFCEFTCFLLLFSPRRDFFLFLTNSFITWMINGSFSGNFIPIAFNWNFSQFCLLPFFSNIFSFDQVLS